VTHRVLVVEDSPAMRAFLRAALEDEGFAEVMVAANGFEALRLLPRERFDLVVTDINMPDIHGLELLAFIRKSDMHRHLPVLIVSTEGAQRDRERGMALGANGYLTKPFEPEVLRATARKLLSEPRASGAGGTDTPSLTPPSDRGPRR
jgi:two-component system, chemotaxis family, chemotaxis protein CheY